MYFYAGCLEGEKKHTWVQYFQFFSSFLNFSHTHLFWGFNLFNSYWCRTFEKKVTLIWIIYLWSQVEVQYTCIESYISRRVRYVSYVKKVWRAEVQSFMSYVYGLSTRNFFLDKHGWQQDPNSKFWPKKGSGNLEVFPTPKFFFLRIDNAWGKILGRIAG